MRIINKSSVSRYLGLIDRTIGPKQRTPDQDPKGFRAALSEILRKLGSSYTIQLTEEERSLVNRILALDQEGQAFKFASAPATRPTVSDYLKAAEIRAKIAQEKEIVAVREREAAIQAETTYASRCDKDEAHKASRKLQGEVVAKKLASTGGKEISLSDLMGDNRFIEEHLKDSNIAMDLSNTEGWKAPKAPEAPEAPAAPEAPEAPHAADQKEQSEQNGRQVSEEPVLADAAQQKKSRKNRKNRDSGSRSNPVTMTADSADSAE